MLARSLRRSASLLGPCRSRLEQPHLLEGLSAGALRKATAVDDRPLVGLSSDGGLDEAEAAKVGVPAEAWLPPHLLHKVLELAKCSGVSTYEKHSVVASLPTLGAAIGTSPCVSLFEGRRCYGTLVEASTEGAEQVLPALSIKRLEASGVELVGSLAPESTPIEIKPKQVFAVVQVRRDIHGKGCNHSVASI